MSQNYKECIHSPGAGHQEMIWNKTLKMKEDGLNESKARELQMVEWDGYHIDVSTAIDRAVVRVYSENTGKAKKKKNWPKANKGEIQSIAEKNPCTLQELRKESPYPESKLKLIPTAAILQLSFPKGSLVCLGESVQSCSTKKVTEFCASNENLPFIVPRTMSEKFGTSQDGKKSPRCNNNTGPERFIVIEFDDMEESVQISMIKYLSGFLPLVLVLHSGGKSFHAWFTGCGASEERVFAFRCRAASLGADRAVFTKSQMVRTPNQTRGKDGKLQELHYFDSSKLPISYGGAPSINFD